MWPDCFFYFSLWWQKKGLVWFTMSLLVNSSRLGGVLMKAMDILPSLVMEIFLLFYQHKTLIIFKKKSEEKISRFEPSLQHTPCNNPTTLPPVQLLMFCTFQNLYIALELKTSLTLTLWPSATLLLMPNQAFPVQPTANDSKIVKIIISVTGDGKISTWKKHDHSFGLWTYEVYNQRPINIL